MERSLRGFRCEPTLLTSLSGYHPYMLPKEIKLEVKGFICG